jgi:hypothetical protein
MPLDPDKLTKETQNALGASSFPTSTRNILFAKAIITHLKTGVVSFLPGGITGIAPSSGGPISDGAGSGGKILLVPSALEGLLIAAFGVATPEISKFAKALSGYIMSDGIVVFDTGTINGDATNTPVSPGSFTGTGAGGKITALQGPALAVLLATAIGKPPTSKPLLDLSTAICDHIKTNSIVALPTATGSVAAGGGPIIAGAGAGGMIS